VSMRRNAAAVIVSVDDAVTNVLGWQPDDLIGRASTEFSNPEDQVSAVRVWFDMLAAPGTTCLERGRYHGADGSRKWVEPVNTNQLDDPDDPVVLTTMTLIHLDQVVVEEDLRARHQLLTRLSDARRWRLQRSRCR
jgi:PAS domain S-box-containing protein